MDKTAFLEMLKDPDVIAAFAAIVPKPQATATLSKEDAKKIADEAVTAALAAHKPKLTEEEETALLKKAEASFVKNIGSNGGLRDFALGGETKDAQAQFSAKVRELTDKGVSLAAATSAAINANPELYAKSQSSLFAAPVTR